MAKYLQKNVLHAGSLRWAQTTTEPKFSFAELRAYSRRFSQLISVQSLTQLSHIFPLPLVVRPVPRIGDVHLIVVDKRECVRPSVWTTDEVRDYTLMVIWAQTFLDKDISPGLILSLRISLRTPHFQKLPNKVSDHWCNVSCFWRFDCYCVFTCRGAKRKRELHVLLKVFLDTPHPTSPCTINFIFGVLSRGSLAKQHDRKTVQNPEAQVGN